MAENKQSVQIQTLDGYPFTGVGGGSQTGRTTKGQNAAADLQQIEGFVTPSSAAADGSYYQFCRVPSNVIIKSVEVGYVGGTVTTAPTMDITIGVSDSTIDGTQVANQVVPSGLVANGITNEYIANPAGTATGLSGAAALFKASQLLTAAPLTDVTFGSGNFTPTGMEQPLWQAAGYSQDPGGMFDIVGLVAGTVSSFTGTLTAIARVRFSMPSG